MMRAIVRLSPGGRTCGAIVIASLDSVFGQVLSRRRAHPGNLGRCAFEFTGATLRTIILQILEEEAPKLLERQIGNGFR
jgi:hypothetical protein